MIYVTGDCHADFTKFDMENFPEQSEKIRRSVQFKKYIGLK